MTVNVTEEVLGEAALGLRSSFNTADGRLVADPSSAARRDISVPASSSASNRRRRGVVRSVFDMAALVTAMIVSYPLAEFLRWALLEVWTPIPQVAVASATVMLFVVPAFVVLGSAAAKGHYIRRRPFWSETFDQLMSVVVSAAVIGFVLFAMKFDFSRSWTVCFLASASILLPVGRVLSRRWLSARGGWELPTLIIDDSDIAYENALGVTAQPDLGLLPVMRLALSDESRIDALADALERSDSTGNAVAGPFGMLAERPHLIVSVQHMDSLIAAKPRFDRLMQACPVLTFLPPISGLPLYRSELIPLFRRDNVMLRLYNGHRQSSSQVIKRSADLAFGILLLILLSPVLGVLALLVSRDGGPAIFSHERIGKGGRRFKCLKFRTMVSDADQRLKTLLDNDPEAALSWERDHKIKDDPRITSVGRFLRKTSLDELPQLFNVLRGEMSLVGPRPIVADEIIRYGVAYDYYRQARPGMTGLWQISGRNDVSYAERVRLDVWYARNWSPWLDIVLLFKTFPIVLRKDGAY